MPSSIRYEINHVGEIVEHESALCANIDDMLTQLFSQNSWTCEITDKTGSLRKIQLTDANSKVKSLNVFAGTIRNELRNPYEKKIQLGSVNDPRKYPKENTIILGIYVFNENDPLKDAIFVGFPVDENIRYDTNPSLRGVFVNKILADTKSQGFVYDTEHNNVGFRSDFIFYYLNNYQKLHYENKIACEIGSDEMFTPEWFNEKGQEFLDADTAAADIYAEFQEKFGPEVLSQLSGKDLLTTIFLNNDTFDNVCHMLEFNKQCKHYMGSISGGTAHKYSLFYSSDKQAWIYGTNRNNRIVDENEACTLAKEIWEYIYAGAKIIESENLATADQFSHLYPQIFEATNGYINKSWVMKYYHMIYPDKITVFYSEAKHKEVLNVLKLEYGDTPFYRIGQIKEYVKKCNISDVVFGRVYHAYCTGTVTENEDTDSEKCTASYHTGLSSSFSRNRILFGAPGTGKSFILNSERKELLYGDKDFDETQDLSPYGKYERVTFHPEYSYANFVGTYKPVPAGNGISYEYVPGPFMRLYVEALKNSASQEVKPFLLVIEEINRANVAAVFGDVFQLLDRAEDNTSEYPIQVSEDVKKYLSREDILGGDPEDYSFIKIPDNMFIWATMNSADQGVFFMDTAFKRRWDFTYIGINEYENNLPNTTKYTFGSNPTYQCEATWNEIRTAINKRLSDLKVNEDKLLGPFFLSKAILSSDEATFHAAFKNKVLMYLFEDAGKQKHRELFTGDGVNLYSALCSQYDLLGLRVFCDDIYSKFEKDK